MHLEKFSLNFSSRTFAIEHITLSSNKRVNQKLFSGRSKKIAILEIMNKDDISPSFRSVRYPKVEPSMEPPYWCTSVVNQYGCCKIVRTSRTYFGYVGHWLSVLSKQTFTKTLFLKITRWIYIFFDKRDRNYMSRTAKNMKFKMHWCPNEGHYWAEKL